jgi:Uma2 family endonuclease
MATVPIPLPWSEQEYLEYEDSSNTRHEFYNGMVVAMAGASRKHIALTSNLLIDLGTQLEDHPCRPAAHDARLHHAGTNDYFYPDLLVECPNSESKEGLPQPRLVIEILSPSTLKIDREYKRQAYRSTPTILDYLIVSQDRIFVEHDTRPDSNSPWQELTYSQPEDIIQLPSIACTLSLARIYRRIDLDPAAA